MEEIVAFVNFVDYFTEEFARFSSCYDFSMTDLSTKIAELATHNDNLLIFYLHYPFDEFSLNFCNFLQDPVIERAFRSDELILYCWDVGNDNLNAKLKESFRNKISWNYSSYFQQKQSAALIIKLNNHVPSVVDVFDDPVDLMRLHDLLTRHSPKEEEITPLSFQKLVATYFGDRDYTSFEEKESALLKKNIGYALYGPPTEMTEDSVMYHPSQQKEIDKVFSQILKQNDPFCKWSGRVVINFIYVCAEALPEDKLKKTDEYAKKKEKYDPDADFMPYPVFVLRKCKHEDHTKACRIIIDNEARVYQSWDAYLENNRLPPCKMVYPKDGRYHSEKTIEFGTSLSPACDLSKKIAAGTDIAAAVTGLVAGGVSATVSIPAVIAAVPAIAAAAPIAIPVAAAIGITTAIYGIARSAHSLVDRSKHEQNIDLSDSESRAAYLNIAGATLSAGMFGAASAVSLLASRGVQLGQGVRFMLYGINGINLAVNGVGIGNSVYEAVQARNLSPLQLAQISASILFFANAVYNFHTVANIVEESQGRALADIESSLRSNKHRKMFNKLLKESIRTQGEVQGKAAVISTIRNMENVNEVLGTLTRSNKIMNAQGIRFSAQNGKICLNGIPVDMTNFGSMNNLNQVSYLKNLPPVPENLTPSAQFTINQDVHMWLKGIGILQGLITRPTVEQLVNEIFSAFDQFVRNFIMDVSKRFFNKLDPAIANRIAQVITDSTIKLMRWIMNKLESSSVFKKVLNHQRVTSTEIDDVVNDLAEQFRSDYVNYEYDTAKNEERREDRKSGKKRKVKKICKVCSGYYYV